MKKVVFYISVKFNIELKIIAPPRWQVTTSLEMQNINKSIWGGKKHLLKDYPASKRDRASNKSFKYHVMLNEWLCDNLMKRLTCLLGFVSDRKPAEASSVQPAAKDTHHEEKGTNRAGTLCKNKYCMQKQLLNIQTIHKLHKNVCIVFYSRCMSWFL